VLLVLVARNGWPYWGALGAAVVVAVVVGVVAELVLMERLRNAPRLVVLVGTIGLGQLCLAGTLFLPVIPPGASGYPTPFTTSWTVGDLVLTPAHLMIIVVAPLLMVALTVFLRRATLGLAVLAYGHNPEGARLVGIRTRRVALAVWVIVSVLSAASAILVSGVTAQAGQQPIGPQVLLPAMAAALVGALSSLPLAFGAGVFIGIAGSLTTWNYPSGGTFELVLLALVMVTLLYRRELAGRGGEEASWSLSGVSRAVRQRSGWARAAGAIVPFVAAAALVTTLDSGHTVLASSIVLFALMGLSVVVLTGFAGQISLAQFAFVGLGAIVGGRAFQLGYPIWVQLVYAAVSGGLVALLVGIPALRVKGPYLAVTSLAFAVAANSWLLRQPWLVKTDASGDSLRIPRQELFGIDLGSERSYFYLCLAALAVGVAVVTRMRTTGFGRSAMATRDNELSAQAMTVAPRRVKLKVFVLAGTISSTAGYLYGGLLVSFGRVGLFDPARSVDLLAMVIFGGVSTVSGAVLGALYVRGIPYFFGQTWGLLATGAGLLLALQLFPDGLAAAVGRFADLRRRAPASADGPEAVEVTSISRLSVRDVAVTARSEETGSTAVAVHDVTVGFGGIVAVDRVSLEVPTGQILALVGANGAGKTTLMDAITGQVPIRSGQVSLFGVDVTNLRPEQRAVMGLGRTFQQARLYPELTLREALKVSLEAKRPTEAVPSLFGLPPSLRAERDQAFGADALLELFNLGRFAERRCGELSTGVRRLAELACVVGVGARVVMLDEPTAGLAQREVEQFPEILRQVRAHLDATLVVIDHDMPVLAELADRMVVLSAGAVVADGTPAAVQADPAVIASYLGTDERVIRRSGTAASANGRPKRTARLTAKGNA
jgi:ABC-type branched-subunit amino acid transport system ATPase component/ABC-type branched-subunit amino acid transport system permease subunit